MAVRVTLIASAGLLAFAGCAHYDDRPLSAEKSRAEFEARTLADQGLKAFFEANHHELAPWPPASWSFTNLTFVAFYFHPDLDLARAQLASADAARQTAGERPNPTLGVGPAYDTTMSIPSPWIVSASLDFPIETAGKRGYRLARAAHLSDVARFNLATTAWQVRSGVRKRLLALYSAIETESLLTQQETIQAESVRLLESQLEAGAISPVEVTPSRLAWYHTRLALHDAEKQAATARVQLAEAIGLPPAALESVTVSFDEFKQLPADVPDAAARRQALVNRADILAALAEYAAAQSALQIEIAKQYPDVRLSPGYQYDQGDNEWGLGLSVELPLLNQNQGRIAEAEAKRQEIAARFSALQARVLTEIEREIASYRASVKKANAADSLNRQLEQQRRAAHAMLEAGDISRVELVQRQLELSAIALARHAALVSAQEALGALEDAMQSPATLVPVSEKSPRDTSDSKP